MNNDYTKALEFFVENNIVLNESLKNKLAKTFLPSKELKEIRKKISQIIKDEFSKYDKRTAYKNSLMQIYNLLYCGKIFGPLPRVDTIDTGTAYIVDYYNIYTIYGYYKHKLIYIGYRINTKFFAIREIKTKIPEFFIKDILKFTNSKLDLQISKSTIYALDPNNKKSLISKDYANQVLAKANKANLPAQLSGLFKNKVKFQIQ